MASEYVEKKSLLQEREDKLLRENNIEINRMIPNCIIDNDSNVETKLLRLFNRQIKRILREQEMVLDRVDLDIDIDYMIDYYFGFFVKETFYIKKY